MTTHRSFKLLCVAALVAIVTLLCIVNTEARRSRADRHHSNKRSYNKKSGTSRHYHKQKYVKYVIPEELKQKIKQQQQLNKKRHSKIAKDAIDATNMATSNENKQQVTAMSEANVDFSFLLLALNWPGSACMSLKPCNGVSPKYTNFTIHGLWPNYESGRGGPESCGEPFNYNIVKSILPSLRQYWPDFKPDEPNFWRHEYEKHGNCAVAGGVVRDQLDYFVKTIDLVKRMPIMTALSRAGIVPSNTVKYNRDQFLDAIVKSGISGRPFMTCQNNIYVRELRFCFNKQLQPIDCARPSGSCAENVILKPVV